MTDTTLVVSEIFGPTWQGEGPSAGKLAHFVRLGGCNLACSWCDTPYTWDGSRFDLRAELGRVSIEELVGEVAGARRVVITGGEPLLQADPLGEFVTAVTFGNQSVVEVETNGTLPPPLWAAFAEWNVSPKLSNAGVASKLHPRWREIRAAFKFVVTGPDDLLDVAAFELPAGQVWIMPEGTHERRILPIAREIADLVLSYGWNMTLRQQVLLWGDERGR